MKIGVIYTLEGMASLAVLEQQWEEAVKLFSWATQQRNESGEQRPPVEQAAVERDISIIREHLSDSDIRRLELEGSTMTMEQAITLAVEETHAS